MTEVDIRMPKALEGPQSLLCLAQGMKKTEIWLNVWGKGQGDTGEKSR